MKLTKVYTSKGIQKVVDFKQLDLIWTDENSGEHFSYKARLESGAIVNVYPLNFNNTSIFIPIAFKGINYEGKEQTAHGKYDLIIPLENLDYTREMQVVFLTGQLVWNKTKDSIVAECASLQAIKKYINLIGCDCIVKHHINGLEYKCNKQTYDRVELHNMIG